MHFLKMNKRMHEKFLLAALEQAKLGQGICAPNPCVGAVAVQNGTIIAQASHQGAGTAHAEQLLLAQLPPKLPELSLYITLEPCNHWGRTPPCVKTIIEYGVKKVFFSYLDPNPLVARNNSSAILRQQGIEVTHIPLKAVDEFYKSYHHWIITGRPRVTAKIAQSLDGKIGSSLSERVILSNALCGQFTHKMRLASDVILTTARTIHLDNPQMNVRLGKETYSKPVAIIDRGLSLDPKALIFSKAKHCTIYHQGRKNKTYPNSTFYSMPAAEKGMDLNAIISHLGEIGYHDVWVEAGGALFTSLHREGLVHRTYIYIVPTCLGEKALSAYQHSEMFEGARTVSWRAQGDNMIACLDWQEDSCLQV